MKIMRLVGSSVLATSSMTAFSYLLSGFQKENYKEPELLGKFIANLSQDLARQGRQEPLGWLTHYAIGAAWSPIQYTFHLLRKPKASYKEALLFGVFGGTIAVLAWAMMFKLAKYPPSTSRSHFYKQLFLAHLVYSLSLWQMIKEQVNDLPDQKPRLLLAQNRVMDIL